MTDAELKQANKDERIAAVRGSLDGTLLALRESGRLTEDKVPAAQARFAAVVARMEAASVQEFMGADYQGAVGIQRLIQKFR